LVPGADRSNRSRAVRKKLASRLISMLFSGIRWECF
jgi:hypothetical protein